MQSPIRSTASRAVPKIANAGTCVYDSVTTTCSGCVSSGVDAPGGGDCGAFGVQEFQGCEVPGGVLNSQLALAVDIILDIASDGAGNITHGFSVIATAPVDFPKGKRFTLRYRVLPHAEAWNAKRLQAAQQHWGDAH